MKNWREVSGRVPGYVYGECCYLTCKVHTDAGMAGSAEHELHSGMTVLLVRRILIAGTDMIEPFSQYKQPGQ